MATAMNMIQLTIIDRVIADPKVEFINNREVTKFRVIYNNEINGETKTLTFNCSAYNGLNKIAQFLKKGRLVCVTANDITQSPWSRDGNSGVNNYIIVNYITIIDKKPIDNPHSPNHPAYDINPDEIPF